MKRVFEVAIKHGSMGYTSTYQVIAKTIDEACKKALAAVKREGFDAPHEIKSLVNHGRAV